MCTVTGSFKLTGWRHIMKPEYVYSKGEKLTTNNTALSNDETQYPKGGRKEDGYWYEYIGIG